MAATFSRTLRLLDGDGLARRGLTWVLLLLVLGWLTWFTLARVPVYEASTKARIEVAAAAHPVAARVGGLLRTATLRIGDHVKEGDILAELDAEAGRLALAEKHVRSEVAKERAVALRNEISFEQESLKMHTQARQIALDEAHAQVREAEAKAEFADRQAQVYGRLRKTNAAAELEYRQAIAQADANRAAVRSLTFAAIRVEKDRAVLESDRRARLAKLERDAVELEGEIKTDAVVIRRLQHEIDLHSIRASVSGRVGEAAELRVGSVIPAGEKLGAIIPVGVPRGVAFFSAAIVGKVQPGQQARVRLEGFAWTQFGTLPATVTDVGNESVNGLVRVELSIAPDVQTPIPLEHGQPGSVEIEVERVSPTILVLRSAGQFLAVTRN